MNNSSHLDFLVVGSGLSALVFAALATKKGANVKVLEAHEHPGGYGHTFSMGKSAKFNAQFHYVWNCGKGETVHQVLCDLGLEKEVTFEKLDPDGFDHMRIPGYSTKIPGDRSKLIDRLVSVSPESEKSIRRFLARVYTVAQGLDLIASKKTMQNVMRDGIKGLTAARYLNATLQDAFDAFHLPAPVQGLLASQWHDFLLPPRELSFFAWVMLFTGYQRGAYYPTHHFEHVIESLITSIQSNGGSVELNKEVTGFLIEDGRVLGVKIQDQISGRHYELSADNVISNVDPKLTASMAGDELFTAPTRKKLDYAYSPSNFMIYCTVKGISLEDYGFGRWNTFHSEDIDINTAYSRMYEQHDYSKPSFAITTPGLMTADKSDRPDGEEIVEFLTVADHAFFEKLLNTDRRAYLQKKKEIVNSIFDIVERDYIPDFRKHVVFKVAGSPTTNERFCRAPAGNSYGANMTPSNIRSRVLNDSSVPGLYFCNATSGFPGFAGAFWNGRSLFEQLENSC